MDDEKTAVMRADEFAFSPQAQVSAPRLSKRMPSRVIPPRPSLPLHKKTIIQPTRTPSLKADPVEEEEAKESLAITAKHLKLVPRPKSDHSIPTEQSIPPPIPSDLIASSDDTEDDRGETIESSILAIDPMSRARHVASHMFHIARNRYTRAVDYARDYSRRWHESASESTLWKNFVSARWEELSQRGTNIAAQLRDPQTRPNTINRFFVSTYKAVGFTILGIIVMAVIGYLASGVFYFLSSSWVKPTLIADSDPRVLQLNTKLADQLNQRNRLKVELLDTKRQIAFELAFQEDFKKALEADLLDRKDSLQTLEQLQGKYNSARGQFSRSARAFSGVSRRQMRDHSRVGLVDTDGIVNRKLQLAQIANADLSIRRNVIDLRQRSTKLKREISALETTLSRKSQTMNYAVLQMRERYERSRIALASAQDRRDSLRRSIKQYDQVVLSLRSTAYLKAANKQASIAFVPYENLESIETDTPLYGCSFRFFWCRNVGKILEVFDGEANAQHPFQNNVLRGHLVRIHLSHRRWAQKPILFAGGAPLLL